MHDLEHAVGLGPDTLAWMAIPHLHVHVRLKDTSRVCDATGAQTHFQLTGDHRYKRPQNTQMWMYLQAAHL